MKIVVLGGSGMIGSRFVELHPNVSEVVAPTHEELDVTDSRAMKAYVAMNKPDVLINFAGFTNLDKSEEQKGDQSGECWRVNVDGVKNILSSIDPLFTHYIHISTDMVFPATSEAPGPYTEEDRVEKNSEKLSWYGYSKSVAELFVETNLQNQATVVRLASPVRSKFDNKLDIVRELLKNYQEKKATRYFSDSQITLSLIDQACELVEKIILYKTFGVVHSSSTNSVKLKDLVAYILEKKGENKDFLESLFSTNFDDKSKLNRKYGGLTVEKTSKKLEFKFNSWQETVDKLIEQGL